MIEVEVRGKIDDFDKTLAEFQKKARFIKEKDRFTMLYFRSGSLISREAVKSEKVDFKLRITNKKPEIVVKYGLVKGSESRKEILIPISLEKFEDAVELFHLLDWHKGVIMATKTFVFNYQEVEFALVQNKHVNYFEAEKLIHKEEDSKSAMKEINKICEEFNLEIFSEEEFFEIMDLINNQRDLQFDLNKQDFSEIKEKFKEFF